MARIIWVGTRFFGPDLEALGHEVFFVDYPQGDWLDWERLLIAARAAGLSQKARAAGLAPDAEPDLVVVSDRSSPPFVLGMEAFPCLTAFYVIDSHIHSWYPQYAQGFDLCLISLKDHLPLFGAAAAPDRYSPGQPVARNPLSSLAPSLTATNVSTRLEADQLFWFPPYVLKCLAEHENASAPDKEWDLLFVGKEDVSINPARSAFLQTLQDLFPGLHRQGGDYRKLFPKGRLLLNHSIAGDLNFRVMEALACGGCLLTPRIGQGLTELFTAGEDLFIFDQDNIPALADLARELLRQPDLCARVAASGLAKVNTRHLGINRAQSLSDILLSLAASGRDRQLVRERLANRNTIRQRHLKYIYLLLAESMDIPALREGYLAAALKND